MSQLSNVTLVDRQSTPVSHTFVPAGISRNGVAKLVEASSVPVGQPYVTLGLTERAATIDPEIRIAVPVVQTQTINGVSTPVVVRTNYAKVTFQFSKLSSQAERNDLQAFVENSMKTTQTLLHDMIVKLLAVY